jgi:phosphatidylserine/phosphatidylglycerophosphate/cardiolipin synthase-like enzyme
MENQSRRLSGLGLTLPLVGALAGLTVALVVLATGCKDREFGKIDAELALSIPKETTLGVNGIQAADAMWLEMIDSAKTTLEFGEFYASNQAGGALEPVLQAIERAGVRGVQVRMVFEKAMLVNDPVTYDRLTKMKNVAWRPYDIKKLTGGIIHAKYFIVDGQEVFVGSQNLDWRALDQIHETGVRVKDRAIAQQLQAVFEIDWKICETGQAPTPPPATEPKPPAEAELVASPPQFNPPGVRPAIQALVELIGSAKKSLKIQVMSYTTGKNRAWTELDDAVRAAAKRGVAVQFLVSDWSLSAAEDLKSLLAAGIDVRYTVIPPYSGGCIPYSRLVHSKFMVVDDDALWVSTSNWEKGYFYATRDVDFIFHRKDLNMEGHAIFDQLWNSKYANKIEAAGTYSRPDTTCGQGR